MPYEQGPEEREYICKVWGMEEILVTNDKYTGKLLWITPRFQCSLHSHDVKQETFVAVDGVTAVEYWIDGKKFDTILVGFRKDTLTIPPKTPHRFWSVGGPGSCLLEISTPHSDADVTRLEPSRSIPDGVMQ